MLATSAHMTKETVDECHSKGFDLASGVPIEPETLVNIFVWLK